MKSYSYEKPSLWKDSPCTMPFVCRNMAVDRTPRFQAFSIYYKDDVHKPKKTFNEFEKPQLLLKNFQRQIEEASLSNRYKVVRRPAQQPISQIEEALKLSNPELGMTATSRLYQVPDKFQFKHDAYGNRSNLVGDYNAKEISRLQLEKKKNFSCGRRTDLSRPLNFYPGPGSYFKESGENSSPGKNQTCVNFRLKKNSITLPNPEKGKKTAEAKKNYNSERPSKQLFGEKGQ